jgi:hypothetical protein
MMSLKMPDSRRIPSQELRRGSRSGGRRKYMYHVIGYAIIGCIYIGMAVVILMGH